MESMKGIIIYRGKYGATQQYAIWLGQELQLPVTTSEEVNQSDLSVYDFVIIAASVYVGKWLLRDWLKERLNMLRNKKLFLFIVCGTPSSERQKQENIIKANIPNNLLEKSGIFFLPGRLIISKLSWKDKLILKLGARLEKDPVKRAAMKHDLDGVSRKMLVPGLSSIRKFIREKSILTTGRLVKMVGKK
jgi:menaquinone-dependent protoporphyrinogen IX oxidase